MLQVPGVTFYSLQLDDSFDRRTGLDFRVTDLSSELTSWKLTAAAMMELDLIISVDTSCADLAGALGRPLWILTPATGLAIDASARRYALVPECSALPAA